VHSQVADRLSGMIKLTQYSFKTDKVEKNSNSESAMYCQLQTADNNHESGKPFSRLLTFVFCFSASTRKNMHFALMPSEI